MPEIPEPKDGVDYYLDELRTHTVAIEVTVRGLKEKDSEVDGVPLIVIRESAIKATFS